MSIASISTDLFTMGVPVAEKALRTAAVYVGILILLRLAGKRDLAQLNSFDFVVLLLLSNVVQNAVIGNDNSLSGGMLGAVILVAGNAVIVRSIRSHDGLIKLFEGSATVLVRDGQLDKTTIARLGLRRADVMNVLREQGASTRHEVAEASLQPGGTITVELKPEAENATKGDLKRLEDKLDRILARL